jgi:hypothetical protein
VKNDKKIFRIAEKIDRSSDKNAESNFNRIARSLETPDRIAFRIA